MRHALNQLLTVIAVALVVITLSTPTASAQVAGERVLLFTKTAGFRHDSIPAGVAMFQQMATDNGWQLTHTEDSTVFSDTSLANFDVIIMFQTSGMVWTTDALFRQFSMPAAVGPHRMIPKCPHGGNKSSLFA